ncbi:unnamed protein product [Closterium sp. NIES-54]
MTPSRLPKLHSPILPPTFTPPSSTHSSPVCVPHQIHVELFHQRRGYVGQRLATASSKGTVVQVYNTADGTRLHELRRGVEHADIYSLAFSPKAAFLVTTSDRGAVHVFSLLQSLAQGQAQGQAQGSGGEALLSFGLMKGGSFEGLIMLRVRPAAVRLVTMVGAVGDARAVDTLEARLEDARRHHEANEYVSNLPLAVIEAGIRSVWAEEHPARPASPRPVNNEGGIDVGVNAGGDQVCSNAGGTSRQQGVIHADEVGDVQARGMRSLAAAGSS